MESGFIAQMIFALAGSTLEISRENLNITRTILAINQENLKINTLTLEATLKRNQIEEQLLKILISLNDKMGGT